ncbi:spindle assembly abnormal 4 isoform X2 [Temnothorax americanus]|uniref:spindle assembly abnormal 4 isoform X2 n=1 Tax=Temnothorax americanus TaxID=1964332 RepID=UPI00406883C6
MNRTRSLAKNNRSIFISTIILSKRFFSIIWILFYMCIINGMDVEASITERLQKLRQWQVEQQERLLNQQRIQREILSHEQDRIYKALGLPTHDFNIIESTDDACVPRETGINAKETMPDEAPQCDVKNSDDVLEIIDDGISTDADPSYENCNEEQSDDSDCASTIVDRSESSMKDRSSGVLSQEFVADSLMEGIKPLTLNNVSNKCALIDDIPLPSPRKDFQTLLEEKLKRESEMPNAQTDAKVKPKKPFLKKGQGLSRFKIPANSRPAATAVKRHNTPVSSNTRNIDQSDKSKSTVHKHALPKTVDNVSAASGKRQLNLKNVPLPKKKVSGKSITPTNRITHNVTASNRSRYPLEINTSDCDSKAERELEEQSTPFKIKSRLNQTRWENGTLASNKEQRDDERTSAMIEQEPMIQQAAHNGKSKSSVQRQVEPRKHSHTNANATVDSYWDTVTVDNLQEAAQDYFIPVNQVLQSDEAYTEHPENHDTSVIAVSSNSDEERGTSMGNDRNLTHDSEASDASDISHHVRFSEYNEYRTIDLIDMSDTANSPPLKNYLEQQNWDDHSSDTESSDITKKLPFNCEKQIRNLSLKIISNEKAVDAPRRSSLQDITRRGKKDSYNYVMKTVHVPEEDTLSYKDGSPDEDACHDNECTPITEEIVRTSDEERSVLSSSLSSSSLSLSDAQELNAHERKEYVLRSEPEKITEKIAKVYSNLREADLYSSEGRTNKTSPFETELLKSRLLELEKEIDIFRRESSALLLQRRKLQEEETILRKQYAEKEKNFEENRRRVQNQLEEEKKRVAREKAAMESRIRDAQEKARQSKTERQKAQALREELEQLRDELNVKESRWSAAESRYKSELRVSRVEISRLKREIANLQNIKKTNVRNLRKSTGQAITKAINQINKRVYVAPSKEPPPKMCQDLSDTSSDTSVHDTDDEDEDKSGNKSIVKAINVNDGFGQIEDDASVNKVRHKQVEIESQSKGNRKLPEGNVVEKKRYLYESLLKDATSDLAENENPSCTKRGMLNDPQPIITQIQNAKSNDGSHSSSTNKDFERAAYVASNAEHYANRSREVNQDSDKNDAEMEMEKRKGRMLPEKNLNSTLHPTSFQSQISKASRTDAVEQIQFPDGRIEYWYPNGNVKKIFPDQEVTKMIYYNGDVRETDKNRRVKYFYAASRTWHTTTPDGLEILEFPDGQVEKRMSDGTVEVLFPDGTVAQTFINGDKILTLPNGQKEIHTKEHKRREYPDGTVKLVYTDGTQETRYSSGRKRLKDKDG